MDYQNYNIKPPGFKLKYLNFKNFKFYGRFITLFLPVCPQFGVQRRRRRR